MHESKTKKKQSILLFFKLEKSNIFFYKIEGKENMGE